MAAQTTDLFRKTGAGTVTTLAAPGKALSATSITVGATTNYPTDTGLVIAIRIVDSAGELVAGTYTEWNAIVASGTSFTIEAAPVYGSDQVYPAGSTTQVFIPLSSSAHNDLIDGILTHADQDGTLKAGAVDVAAVLATDVVETAKIKDLNVTTAKIAANAVTPEKWANPYKFSAYLSSNTAIASATQKIALGSELFDTNSNFDSTTNYRYTAPVDGFYQIDAQAGIGTSGMGANESAVLALYKNGSLLLRSEQVNGSGDAFRLPRPRLSGLIQLSASDYLELYVIMGGVYRDITGGSSITYFTGYLVSRT